MTMNKVIIIIVIKKNNNNKMVRLKQLKATQCVTRTCTSTKRKDVSEILGD